ncbi:MAG: single-stranded-DNA-specific exonuclease RecJ [Pseudomonadota bacterium]
MATEVQLRQREVPGSDFSDDVHPLLRRIYAARGVRHAAELRRGLEGLEPPTALGGLDAAVMLLAAARDRGDRVLVIGDFDADGATSCAVACLGLRELGVADVDYLVPNRFEYGYGLTPEIVAEALTRGPDLIVTVDNGVASVAGVAKARAAGVQVLVTDHHLPGPELPQADAIVNPNLDGDSFPSKHLAGVGVIFYVLLALRAHLRSKGAFAAPAEPRGPNLARLLDLVALGTVADVVPLDANNRILVHQGLQRMRAGHMCAGLAALLEVAGRNAETVTAADLAFGVGPRLNAAGRLDDISVGIECLMAPDRETALPKARELNDLNQARREIETEMRDDAQRVIAAMPIGDEPPPALCLHEHDWHPGVVGIVAARIKDQVNRPVIAFARDGDEHLRGSARSIAGVHLRDAIAAVDARSPGLIARFGGHAMAAGLTIPTVNLERFRLAFVQEIAVRLAPEIVERVLWTDGEIPAERLTLELAELIRDAGPWGQGFPEPLFEGEFALIEQRIVGGRHLKLKVEAPIPPGRSGRSGRRAIDAIVFNFGERVLPADRARLAYRLDVNHYRGLRTLQLMVEHVEAL